MFCDRSCPNLRKGDKVPSLSSLILSWDSYSPWTFVRLQMGGAQPALTDATSQLTQKRFKNIFKMFGQMLQKHFKNFFYSRDFVWFHIHH